MGINRPLRGHRVVPDQPTSTPNGASTSTLTSTLILTLTFSQTRHVARRRDPIKDDIKPQLSSQWPRRWPQPRGQNTIEITPAPHRARGLQRPAAAVSMVGLNSICQLHRTAQSQYLIACSPLPSYYGRQTPRWPRLHDFAEGLRGTSASICAGANALRRGTSWTGNLGNYHTTYVVTN